MKNILMPLFILITMCAGCGMKSKMADIVGMAKFRAKDYKGAIEEFDKAIILAPLDTNAYYYRAVAKRNLKNYEGALKDFATIAHLNPHIPTPYYEKGITEFAMQKYQDAIADYDTCLMIKPDFGGALCNRGRSEGSLKYWKEAEEDFTKAIAIAHRDTAGHWYLALSYTDRGLARYNLNDSEGAFKNFDSAILASPNYFKTYFNRGFIEYSLKDYDRALQDYNMVLSLFPKTMSIHFYIGQVYIKQGHKSLGCAEMQKAADMGFIGGADSVKKYCE